MKLSVTAVFHFRPQNSHPHYTHISPDAAVLYHSLSLWTVKHSKYFKSLSPWWLIVHLRPGAKREWQTTNAVERHCNLIRSMLFHLKIPCFVSMPRTHPRLWALCSCGSFHFITNSVAVMVMPKNDAAAGRAPRMQAHFTPTRLSGWILS